MSVSLVRRSRASNATFRWLDGHDERVRVIVQGEDRAYVAWPEAVRTFLLDGVGITVSRPAGWVELDRLRRDYHQDVSPNGVSHALVRGRCITCGDVSRHAEWLPAQCDHSESLWGRCVACGLTWANQAAARSELVFS